jgi:hypothetical protein
VSHNLSEANPAGGNPLTAMPTKAPRPIKTVSERVAEWLAKTPPMTDAQADITSRILARRSHACGAGAHPIDDSGPPPASPVGGGRA